MSPVDRLQLDVKNARADLPRQCSLAIAPHLRRYLFAGIDAEPDYGARGGCQAPQLKCGVP